MCDQLARFTRGGAGGRKNQQQQQIQHSSGKVGEKSVKSAAGN